jgi:hypothetical protein
MSVEVNSALVAKIADSYVKAPRLAWDEFQAIVSAFRELHSEFTTRVADAYSEYLDDRVHASGELHLPRGARYQHHDHDDDPYIQRQIWDQIYEEIAESFSQEEKDQMLSEARAVASKHCNTRAIEIACRGALFCRSIDAATMERADPFELAGTIRLKTIVCQDLIPIGHPTWWEKVFDPNFKHAEANFRTFTDRVACLELKARAPAGAGQGKPTRKVNAKGSQSDKLVAYLAKHHDYDSCRVGNYHPAESADIARESKAKPSTVSDFLKREFPCNGSPRTGYVQACTNQARLLHWFMVQFKDSLPERTGDIDTFDQGDIRETF